MDRFAALTIFVAVAERGGFKAASRHLGVSPPAVTRTIAALERHLGVPLFRRSTRSVALTEEGAALLERAREILMRLQDAEHVVMGRQTTPQGELQITAPVVFGRLHVLPVVADLLARHRQMSVRLMLLDRNIRLVEEGIDVAVRIGEPRDSSLRSVAVGTVRQVLVASPTYCAARGHPADPKALDLHDLIAGDNVRTGSQWRFGPHSVGVAITPRLTVTSIDAQLAAAAAGLGIANVLSYQAAEGLAAGTLRRVLDAHAPPPVPIHLLFDAGRANLPSVRLFLDGMRARAKSGAWQ
ncbi:LysR family transcriptional regulator [Methylobacterium sp. WL120]|uniref:LysR family transcriptional regulator n=1 Tax=Methylobacterium sp. WL120 TaxID=2603887 RepID=UPI0011C84F87|nr:LysR family transcriptional regulator [Methylobacterium sp. WL120]TXM64972.1 LysR family transcriptional regulator [Methylobacterium sp. WL120]